MQSNTVDTSKMSKAQLEAHIQKLMEQNQQLAAKVESKAKITLKVSAKGALSIYGMGRWPVTLYKSQAERLFSPEVVAQIHKFMADNASQFTTKEGESATAATA